MKRQVACVVALAAAMGVAGSTQAAAYTPPPMSIVKTKHGKKATIESSYLRDGVLPVVTGGVRVESAVVVAKKGKKTVARGTTITLKRGKYKVTQQVGYRELQSGTYQANQPWAFFTSGYDCVVTDNSTGAIQLACDIPALNVVGSVVAVVYTAAGQLSVGAHITGGYTVDVLQQTVTKDGSSWGDLLTTTTARSVKVK